MSKQDDIIEKIKALKTVLNEIDSDVIVPELTEWEYKFIQDQNISVEEFESVGLLADFHFSDKVIEKIDELYEKFFDYLPN